MSDYDLYEKQREADAIRSYDSSRANALDYEINDEKARHGMEH